jgi:hypothetical protein
VGQRCAPRLQIAVLDLQPHGTRFGREPPAAIVAQALLATKLDDCAFQAVLPELGVSFDRV